MASTKSSVVARPFGAQRQAIVSFGDTHIVIGSPFIRDTISRSSDPTDLLLATLATDCTFTLQEAATQAGILLNSLTTTANWVESENGAIRLRFALNGPSEAEVRQLLENLESSCQMYKLLARSIMITFETVS